MLFCRGWSDNQLRAFRLRAKHAATRVEYDLHPVARDLAKLTKTDCDLKLTGYDAAPTRRFLTPVFDPSTLASIPKVAPVASPAGHETPKRDGRRSFSRMEVRFNAAA
jgi:hypothetical protein